MKTVKVFVASSIIEFEEERIYLGAYVRKLNDSLLGMGHKVRLFLCEDEKINSQPFYDRSIENSDVFIALIGSRLGEFTKHEIVDVADRCASIRKKVLVLTSKNSTSLIPDHLQSKFEICTITENLSEKLVNLLSDQVEEIVQELYDEPDSLSLQEFILNIPDSTNIEVAVINNIIRRLRDQCNNIIVHDNIEGSEQAYIALLSDKISSEEKRIKELIELKINSKLWLYAQEKLSRQSILPIDAQLKSLHDTIIKEIAVYPDYYASYNILSILIENKLLKAICQNQPISDSFIYELEDHWLFRSSLITKKKHLVVNLYNIDDTPERRMRRERIIVNLLNQYWLSGRLDKHFDAITKLLQGDFDSFIYTLDDINKLKFEEYGQGFYDYLCDKLESIQQDTLNRDADWVSQELEELSSLLQQRQFLLSPTNIISAYLLIANTYSLFPVLSNKAIYFYRLAISSQGPITIKSGIIELSKYYLLVLCMSLFDSQNRCDEEIIDIANVALQITNKEDELYFNAFKIIQYAASTDNAFRDNLEIELNSTLNPDFVSQSNNNLLLYLTFVVTWLHVQYTKNVDLSIYLPLIDYCFDQYNRYLRQESYYMNIYETLCSKKALATKDLNLISSVLDNYSFNHDCQLLGKHYYDILYDKGSICIKEQKIDDAIIIFEELSNSYKGNYDKGASLQSLALCYMAKYGDSSCLKNAEEAYKKALELFSMLKDRKMCGNVWDGLSYCYLLQKKYSGAEEVSLHSLEISEYDAPNKYANYISSLLCQNKKSEAVSFYFSLPDKEKVKEQFEKDWKNEMKEVGIDTDAFFELFEMQ